VMEMLGYLYVQPWIGTCKDYVHDRIGVAQDPFLLIGKGSEKLDQSRRSMSGGEGTMAWLTFSKNWYHLSSGVSSSSSSQLFEIGVRSSSGKVARTISQDSFSNKWPGNTCFSK